MSKVDAGLSQIMWSIAQIAERDGVSKQAVSKKARRLSELHGLTTTRDNQDRITSINVVEYDHIRGRVDDPSKAQGGGKRSGDQQSGRQQNPAAVDESYDEALRQKTWYEAERSRLRLEEEKGQLVRADQLTNAVVEVGSTIVRIIDKTLPGRADALMAAFNRDGISGMRTLLKSMAHQMRTEIASEMQRLATSEVAVENSIDTPESAESGSTFASSISKH